MFDSASNDYDDHDESFIYMYILWINIFSHLKKLIEHLKLQAYCMRMKKN